MCVGVVFITHKKKEVKNAINAINKPTQKIKRFQNHFILSIIGKHMICDLLTKVE